MKYISIQLLSLALLTILTGCENTLLDRSLIFSTHTNFGLELSANPVETSSPIKMQIGYQRTESVINPVYYNHKAIPDKVDGKMSMADWKAWSTNYDINDYYRTSAYSVIAKFTGEAKTSGNISSQVTTSQPASDDNDSDSNTPSGNATTQVNGGMTLSQWFATGKAAELLAQHGAATALTDKPTPGAASQNGFAKNVSPEAKAVAFSILWDIWNARDNLPKAKQAIESNLNDFAKEVKVAKDIIFFEAGDFTHPALTDITISTHKAIESNTGFKKASEYSIQLTKSQDRLKDASLEKIWIKTTSKAHAATPADKATVRLQITKHKDAIATLEDQLNSASKSIEIDDDATFFKLDDDDQTLTIDISDSIHAKLQKLTDFGKAIEYRNEMTNSLNALTANKPEDLQIIESGSPRALTAGEIKNFPSELSEYKNKLKKLNKQIDDSSNKIVVDKNIIFFDTDEVEQSTLTDVNNTTRAQLKILQGFHNTLEYRNRLIESQEALAKAGEDAFLIYENETHRNASALETSMILPQLLQHENAIAKLNKQIETSKKVMTAYLAFSDAIIKSEK